MLCSYKSAFKAMKVLTKEKIISIFYTREKMKLKEIKLFTESVAEEPKPLDCCTI